jgi:integrase
LAAGAQSHLAHRSCLDAASVPMRTIQEWMGHASIQTTLIYADYAPNAHDVDLVNSAFAGTNSVPS